MSAIYSDAILRPIKRILLFGKTGDGKSTVANMLTNGDVNGEFATGNSLAAVTTQTNEVHTDDNWIVIDTMGVFATDESEKDLTRTQELRSYLAEKHEEIDLFCYIKKASTFTSADDQCWSAFHSLFAANGDDQQSYHRKVLLVFTSCSNKRWLKKNVSLIDDKMSAPNPGVDPYRRVAVDFPPHDDDPVMESKLKETRAASLAALKGAIKQPLRLHKQIPQPVKKILLFGKTGDGKSTVANMLTEGNVVGEFEAGNSLAAVTTQTNEVQVAESNWIVIDTVGMFATDEPEKDLKRTRELRNYLVEKHGEIDVFCYLKKASKFTRADEQCWRAFHSLFAENREQQSYHDNVLLIFTSCTRKRWLDENVSLINEKMAGPGSDPNSGRQRAPYRRVAVNFPPHDDDPVIESKLKDTRDASLAALKGAIEEIKQPLRLHKLE